MWSRSWNWITTQYDDLINLFSFLCRKDIRITLELNITQYTFVCETARLLALG